MNTSSPLARLFAYAHPYKARLGWAVVAMAFYAVGSAGLAALIKTIFDNVLQDRSQLGRVAWLIIGLNLLKGIGSYGSSYLMAWVGQRVVMDLRNALYSHILGQSASFFGERSTGDAFEPKAVGPGDGGVQSHQAAAAFQEAFEIDLVDGAEVVAHGGIHHEHVRGIQFFARGEAQRTACGGAALIQQRGPVLEETRIAFVFACWRGGGLAGADEDAERLVFLSDGREGGGQDGKDNGKS